jgi:hypothetical protein
MIYAGPPVSRRVLHNCGLTVVIVPADTDYLPHSRVTEQNASAPGWCLRTLAPVKG